MVTGTTRFAKADHNVDREYYRKVQHVGQHKKDDVEKAAKRKENHEGERKNSPDLSQQSHDESGIKSGSSENSVPSATSEVEQNWRREHGRKEAR